MKKEWKALRMASGALNIMIFVFLLALHFWLIMFSALGALSLSGLIFGLPLSAGAILALFGGINMLKGKRWGWAFAGFICAIVGWIYFYVIAMMFAFIS